MLLLYISPLIINTVLGLFLALFISRNRRAPGAPALIALVLGATLWSLGYALEILSPGLHAKLFWAKFQYLGITTIPIAWFFFSVSYLGSPGRVIRSFRYWAVLGIVPVLTLCLVWTNEVHGLVWRWVQLQSAGPAQMLEIDHGPWFWVYLTFGYCLILLGSARLMGRLLGSIRFHRWQIILALLAILIPWIGNLVYVTGLIPAPGLDWTPLSFTAAGLLFSISLFRFHLIDISPIAQKTVFDGLADCLLVLDLQGCIVDLNPSARKLVGGHGEELYGKPLDGILPELSRPAGAAGRLERFLVEISLGEGPGRCSYDLLSSPLFGPYGLPIGRLLVLHDISLHKQLQAHLEQARAQLEETVSERTEALRQAVHQLQCELDQRTMAEKRFEEVVEAAPDAMLLVDGSGAIILINVQTERLFGYSREELLGQNIESLVPLPLRQEYNHYFKKYLADPSIRKFDFGLELFARRKDGSEFPAEISLGRLNTLNGVCVACNIRDSSERKQSELALLESAQTYQALFENAGDAIFLAGLEGDIQKANQKAAGLLGYTQEELQALTVSDIVLPEELPDERQKMDRVLSGQTLPPYVRYFRDRAGVAFPVEVNLVLVRDPKGKPRFFQAIVRDVTERMEAERAQNRLLEEVKGSREQLHALALRLQEVREFERRQIAAELHDRVGQNLTGLNLNLQIVQNQLRPEASAALRGRLGDSLKLVEETTRQVRDVMADLHPPVLDEYGLVSALHWYSGSFSERTGIPTQVVGDEFGPRLPPGVEMVLFRLVQEALNNVAKHARATQVVIRVESSEYEACLTIEDDGMGFDPRVLDGPAGPPHWGLLIMQQRAASIGAQLAIDSAPGRGTRVSIYLRRSQDGH